MLRVSSQGSYTPDLLSLVSVRGRMLRLPRLWSDDVDGQGPGLHQRLHTCPQPSPQGLGFPESFFHKTVGEAMSLTRGDIFFLVINLFFLVFNLPTYRITPSAHLIKCPPQCPSRIHPHPPPSSPSTTPSSFPRVRSLHVLSPFLIFPTRFSLSFFF